MVTSKGEAMQIGNVTLPNPYILAPMAGVTDLPFRVLCAEMGAGMVCTEMISAKALSFKNKNTYAMLKTAPEEGIVSLQIFGSEPELMGEVAATLEEYSFQILDINMGCPVPKVAGNGEGSALLKDPALAGRIMKCVSSSTKKPVTAKIRLGFDKDHINAVEVAKILEDNGAAAITVHGRTREQYYSGEADWEAIAKVKEAVSIPIIGNGDVKDSESARKMFEITNCDGIAIGRAARGNPWIFRNFTQEADSSAFHDAGFSADIQKTATTISATNMSANAQMTGKPHWPELSAMILRHAEMLVEEKGEYTAIREMRQHIAWYSAGMRGATALRRKVNEINTLNDLQRILSENHTN